MAVWKRRSLVLVSLLCTACAANSPGVSSGQTAPPPPGPSLSITSSVGASAFPSVTAPTPPPAGAVTTSDVVTTEAMGSPDGAPPPTPRVNTTATARRVVSEPPAPPVKEFVFRLEVGDELEIKVWQEPELTSKQRILRDGTISPNLLKPMQAVGKSIHELHEELTLAYREYINDPSVSVRMVDVYRDRVFFLGEVKTPSAHTMIGPTTVLQGIALAGGFNEGLADKAVVRIVRTTPSARVFTVNAERIITGNARRVMLEPGDIVYVHPTGLTDWSRRFTQLLSPLGDLLGTAASAAAIAVAIDNN